MHEPSLCCLHAAVASTQKLIFIRKSSNAHVYFVGCRLDLTKLGTTRCNVVNVCIETENVLSSFLALNLDSSDRSSWLLDLARLDIHILVISLSDDASGKSSRIKKVHELHTVMMSPSVNSRPFNLTPFPFIVSIYSVCESEL
jgi:hypothetical protein